MPRKSPLILVSSLLFRLLLLLIFIGPRSDHSLSMSVTEYAKYADYAEYAEYADYAEYAEYAKFAKQTYQT